ncbi:MAG: FAD-binding oxidoreductase [Ilumatobacteraceae bacterium]
MTAGLAGELAGAVGGANVLVDDDVRATYEVDWTRRYQGTCTAVVRPGSTDEVAAVLRICGERGAIVVTQGGNTGLVGAGVPRPTGGDTRPCVVVSTRRLTDLGPVDVGAGQVTVGAGATLAAWRDHAREAGLDAPVDFAARDSATVGGAIATNAGGSRVVRFGTMRSQVLGIEAVLADGRVIGSLAGLPKETVGLHLPSLLAGSEGTLAVVTAARLRLVPWYRNTITAMVATADLPAAVSLLGRLRGAVTSLDAVELVLPEALDLVAAHVDTAPPVTGGGAYVLVDCADHTDPTDQLTDVLGSATEVLDAAVTTDGPGRAHLLLFRDRITEAINAAGVPFKLDVAVPVARLGDLLDAARSAVGRHGGRLIPFGHLAEGNVHLNVLDLEDPDRARALADEVLPAVAEMGGTISAEHGVGIAKTPWLHLVRSPAELATMAAVRSALDPAGLLNPGVLTAP